jgi:hypothetical protein
MNERKVNVTRILRYLADHALALVALICSLLALAGASYAAFTISGSQIRNHTINPSKLNPRFINGNVRAWALVGANGKVIVSAGRPRVTQNVGLPSEYIIRWGVKVSRCATVASIDGADSRPTEQVTGPGNSSLQLASGYAVASTFGTGRKAVTLVDTYNQAGGPTQLAFNVAVIC